MGRGFHCAWRRGGVRKKIPPRRDAWIALFVTGIEWDTGQRENCPSLASRPKLPAPAGHGAVTRESAGCRNRLLTGYRAAESDLAAETLFLSRRLSFRRLLALAGQSPQAVRWLRFPSGF